LALVFVSAFAFVLEAVSGLAFVGTFGRALVSDPFWWTVFF
jgi:hypothetical protein